MCPGSTRRRLAMMRPEDGEVPIAPQGRGSERSFLTAHEQRLVRIGVGCEFDFDTSLPVPAVVLLRARSDGCVTVGREASDVQPSASFSISSVSTTTTPGAS